MHDCRIRVFLTLCCLLGLAAPAIGQEPVSLRGYLDPPLVVPDFSAPQRVLFVSQPFLRWVEEWSSATRSLLKAQERRMLVAARTGAADAAVAQVADIDAVSRPVTSDSVSFLPPPPQQPERSGNNPLGGLVGDNADLGIVVTGNGSLGGAWTRYKPCDPSLYFNCDPGLFPQLKPDVEFGIRVGGTISQRVHVDVDYDQAREFDAANNINVYYQGLADEVLQRLEVGDVSIRLPTSRYLTRGIPAGNFGFMASGQLGPLDFQTVFAQQKGDLTTREFKLGGGATEGLVQDATLVLDDAEYVKGQFFFLVPPAELLGQPHVDVLALRPTDAAAAVRPELGGTIEVYRDERPGAQGSGQPAQVGYFLADAVPPGGGPRHTGSFRRLIQEQDYIVHASGLWIMLRSPLRSDEALAVSFITETGDTVGTVNAEASPPGTTPQLQLLRGPASTHQPGLPTWDLEMHQVYRLDSSSEVDLQTIELTISLGEEAGGRTFRDVLGQQLTFLKFFGLDEDSPADRLDAGQVFQPAREGFSSGTTPIGGTFIVLPTLRPFAAPAPVASARLSAEDLLAALGRDANGAIYLDPDPVNRAGAARFRLNFSYRVKVEGLVSSFSLGAFGIRESSERLTIGARPLVRDVDYTIDYEIGTVTLLDPQNLFATQPQAEIHATWEQKPLFSIAPTSVFGASARYRVGERGELNFVGLYQAEKSLMSRPQLGVEPGSTFLGGVSGSFDLGGALLDRVIGGIPGMRSERVSAVSLNGELAFSMPNPNRHGAAYLDDFEASDEVGLSVRRQDWRLGSMPQSSEGDRGTLPLLLDAASAAPLVWQHDFLQNGRPGGALLPQTDIDRQINIVGNELPEPVLWLTFGRAAGSTAPLPPPPDEKRWRSMTTQLSTTGRDMSRSEYLEFYVGAGSEFPMALVIDIGTVSEDAFFVDSLGLTTGTYPDGKVWGEDRLDEEASLINREVWGRDRDELGLWNQQCQGEPHTTFALGDARVNCTRNNGLQDTEDLNGNGILDADDGQYFRYVVQLDQLSEYLVRDTDATGTVFRLYRIPLRSGVSVNGANDGTWRFIRHLRITVAGEPQGQRLISLARMRIIGSRWTKRDVHGIQQGLLDAVEGAGAALAEMRVGPVSRLTDGASYAPPPGVSDQLQDPTQQFGGAAYEINEKSLRIDYTSLQPGERAETYFRYPQQPRNLLTYGELRLWALPRRGNWGDSGDQQLLVRIGTDARNYYLYRTRLRPATGPRAATSTDWLPEVVIDFNRWFELRAQAEQLLIERGPRPAGLDTVWSADSAYAIVLEDRGRAPNLAAVREITFAVYNGGAFPADGEVWLDDLRVLGPDTDPGAAGNINLDVVAGDLLNARFSVANQGPLFRQLNESPTFVGGADIAVNADARLEKLLPASWGIDLPLSVSHSRNAQTPTFLQQSDVLADRLTGLREADASNTRIGIRLSKRTPTANPLLSMLIDGVALRMSYNTAANQSITYRSENSGFMSDISYRRDIAPRTFGAVPGFLGAALRALAPAVIERSDAFQRLLGSDIRWSPSSLSFGSIYSDQVTRAFRYDRILALPTDSAVVPIESPRQMLRNDANLTLRPFTPLTASIGIASDRDVLAAERASTQAHERAALQSARSSFAGVDIGWETARAITTTLSYRPDITRWLNVGYSYNNRYITDRNPSYLDLGIGGGDSTAELQRRFESSRQTSRTVRLQPGGMAGALGLDSTSFSARMLRGVELIDVAWSNTLSSQFERERFLPGLGYQLGLGSFETFRAIDADTAARAQQRDQFRIDATMALPLGARLNVGYHNSDIESFDLRGGTRTQDEVGWPKATLQWRDFAVPSFMRGFVNNMNASLGVERIERTSELGGNARQTRGATDVRIPASLQLGLRRGFTAIYRASYSLGETLDPTGNAENGGYQHDVTLSGMFEPPQAWRSKLNGPITVQLNYTEQQQRQCRFNAALADLAGCIAFLDVGSRTMNMRLESMISDLNVGLLLNYVARQNQVGTRTGSTQFNLSLYGRFNFTAGQMPERYR